MRRGAKCDGGWSGLGLVLGARVRVRVRAVDAPADLFASLSKACVCDVKKRAVFWGCGAKKMRCLWCLQCQSDILGL